jgi:hypothetical protein
VADAPLETWARLNFALGNGKRGLSGGSSLAKLLAVAPRYGIEIKLPGQ